MKSVFTGIFLALFLWFVMFSPWTAASVNFWLMMSFSAVLLSGLSLLVQSKRNHQLYAFQKSDILIGIVSAVVLYLIFLLGHRIVTNVFSFGSREVSMIYMKKSQLSPAVIGFLLVFIIGPAEAIFWQGLIQQRVSVRVGPLRGCWMTSLIYALVHLWAFNLTLFLAALVCGLFWGFLYMKTQRLWPVMISHALWDVVIFILLPIQIM